MVNHAKRALHWFRQDLRTHDNPSLDCVAQDHEVLPVFIFDEHEPSRLKTGEASQWWLHHSLEKLNLALVDKLNFYQGSALETLLRLCHRYEIELIAWNRCYQADQIQRDSKIKQVLLGKGIQVKTFNSSLINEPWTIRKPDGKPYKVFTPYYQKAKNGPGLLYDSPISPKLDHSKLIKDELSLKLESLKLLPKYNWVKGLRNNWKVGEAAAQEKLYDFTDVALRNYRSGRDYPSENAVSGLSPHLRFGEISPRQILRHFQQNVCSDQLDDQLEHFQRELVWREFSYYLLYHHPDMPHQPLKKLFQHVPWRENQAELEQWQQGQTGFPLIDAGMRELWQTGYMHNRLRMITASFLVKNLLIDWRKGADWFWDCLVDADLASNSASWQWVAGCGTDAAPYFRIFNPVTQGEKFDPKGLYTRKFVPELQALPDRYLFQPWKAPEAVLSSCNIQLGKNYPKPVLDLKYSRERALSVYQSLKRYQD